MLSGKHAGVRPVLAGDYMYPPLIFQFRLHVAASIPPSCSGGPRHKTKVDSMVRDGAEMRCTADLYSTHALARSVN